MCRPLPRPVSHAHEPPPKAPPEDAEGLRSIRAACCCRYVRLVLTGPHVENHPRADAQPCGLACCTLVIMTGGLYRTSSPRRSPNQLPAYASLEFLLFLHLDRTSTQETRPSPMREPGCFDPSRVEISCVLVSLAWTFPSAVRRQFRQLGFSLWDPSNERTVYYTPRHPARIDT